MLRETNATLAPPPASRIAANLPIPLPAPVINATLPIKPSMLSSSDCAERDSEIEVVCPLGHFASLTRIWNAVAWKKVGAAAGVPGPADNYGPLKAASTERRNEPICFAPGRAASVSGGGSIPISGFEPDAAKLLKIKLILKVGFLSYETAEIHPIGSDTNINTNIGIAS
ncbi:hypothetical protein [Mesorhizobium sp. B2-3-15]|uniref:hypothetical protein n=1 Tax=Mesorhizobium sp. B2-3-15 TaxID=2589949 RepID=UPI0015E39983|nr:hypothetical protein [Mesorhizobium sp. B2-3-15]